jgi:tetratricopeptide (TPR) repeat protein
VSPLPLLVAAAVLAAQPDPEELGPFRACLSLSDDTEALPHCRRAALEAAPASRAPIALLILGIRLGALGRWDEAAEAYRRGVDLEPERASAWRRLGEALLNGTGALEPALAALDESVRLDGDDARTHGFRGVALNALGRHAEAVRAFEDALQAEPSFFTMRPAARQVLEASQRGLRWPPGEPEDGGER